MRRLFDSPPLQNVVVTNIPGCACAILHKVMRGAQSTVVVVVVVVVAVVVVVVVVLVGYCLENISVIKNLFRRDEVWASLCFEKSLQIPRRPF